MKVYLLLISVLIPFTSSANDEILLNQSAPIPRAGIPVFDAAGIAQMVMDATEQAQRFKQQFENMKAQLDTAKATADHYKKMVEGHWDIADILNDPSLINTLPKKWESFYSNAGNLDSLRDKYNLKSNNPEIQKLYDNDLIALSLSEQLYNSSYETADNIQKLHSQFNKAQTPSTKQDLSNAINYEVAKLQSQKMIIEKIDQLQEQERKLQQRKNANEFMSDMFGDYR